MLRIIRTTTLNDFRAGRAELEELRGKLRQARTEATTVKEYAARVDATTDTLLTQLAQAQAARVQAERERTTARAHLESARREFEETGVRIRELLEELREAVHTPDVGTERQARLALVMMRRFLAEDIAQGTDDALTQALARLLAPREDAPESRHRLDL